MSVRDFVGGLFESTHDKFTLFAFAIVIGIGTYNSFFAQRPPVGPASDLPGKIKSLTDNLAASQKTMAEIEEEVKKRSLLVDRLQRDAVTAKKLSSLNKEQTEAVAQALKAQIVAEEDRTWMSSQLSALFFTALGVLLDRLWGFAVRWYRGY